MKKTILLGMMFILMISVVLALDPYPYPATIYDTQNYSIDQNGCVLYQGSIYCLGNDLHIYKYDVVQKILTDTGYNWTPPGPNPYSWFATCGMRQNLMVCGFAFSSSPGGKGGFVINLDTFEQTLFNEYTYGNAVGSCALRPGEDQVWCYGYGYSDLGIIKYYDLSDAQWTLINMTSSGYIIGLRDNICTFKDSNNLWCYGGYGGNAGETIDELMHYDIQSQTATYKYAPVAGAQSYCRWYNDKLYCIGLDDYDTNILNASFSYDPMTDIFTEYASPFSGQYAAYGGCVAYTPLTDICLAGYIEDYGYNQNIYQISYPAPSSPEPTPEVQPTRRGGNNAAYIVQQNLQKQAEATQSKPTNFFDAIVQVIHNIRRALGLEG